jgi:hypothetical protein
MGSLCLTNMKSSHKRNRASHNTSCTNTVELGFNFMTGTQYFVSLYKTLVLTEEANVMVNSE